MSTRFSSPRFPPPKPKPESEKDTNALWRLEQWFPKLAADRLKLLKDYHTELLKFNVRLNLVSRSTEREADEVHFADCVLASEILAKQNLGSPIYDIGSGNGLPGLALAILNPKLEFCLVESDSRKGEFLLHVAHTLGLKNAKVLNVRFESLAQANVRVAVSRGFASISKTVLTCNKIFSKGAMFYHLKGASWSSEIAQLPSQLISVWRPELVGEYSLPTSQARRGIVRTTKLS